MTTLFRPVGLNELSLIWDSGMREFPPRLPHQPIFYPVANREYATQIARDWNTKDSSFAGYVTKFSVQDSHLAPYDPHTVGSATHVEYWIPAEELPRFNASIQGTISVESLSRLTSAKDSEASYQTDLDSRGRMPWRNSSQ